MSIRSKLSVAFSIAATFLLVVGIAAIYFIGQLNPLLDNIARYNFQMNLVADVASAVRSQPDQAQHNLARMNDLENWARTDTERSLVSQARQALSRDRTVSVALDKLDELGAFYRQGATEAQKKLATIHRRAVVCTTAAIAEGVLLLCVMMFLVREWLLKPMLTLRDASQKIAAGDLQQQAITPPSGEFAELATAINTLTASRKELAERVSRLERLAAVGESCSHVSHNMRSLLAAIHSLAHYERNAPNVTADARTAFDHIIATTDTLERWVRDIIHTLRPLELKPVRQQIEPVIHDSLALLNPRLAEKAIEVAFEPQDDLPAVHLDRALFEQALIAIVSNAIDASPRNGRIVIVTVGGENGVVIVRIEDEGAGMSEDIQRRVFDQFFTTKPQAAGLGLFIADKIIKLHGGRIEIDSQSEKGTRVSIHLPAATGQKSGR